LIVGWSGQFLFFVVLRQFSQVVGEWPENQILIPDWTYFSCPGATLGLDGKIRPKIFESFLCLPKTLSSWKGDIS